MQYQSMEKPEQQTSSYQAERYYELPSKDNTSTMPIFIATLSYITIIGWLVAIVMYGSHKSEFVKFHLKQSIGLIITGAILILIPLIGWLLNLMIIFAWGFAIYHVIQGHMTRIPLLGAFYQSHLDFIK